MQTLHTGRFLYGVTRALVSAPLSFDCLLVIIYSRLRGNPQLRSFLDQNDLWGMPVGLVLLSNEGRRVQPTAGNTTPRQWVLGSGRKLTEHGLVSELASDPPPWSLLPIPVWGSYLNFSQE